MSKPGVSADPAGGTLAFACPHCGTALRVRPALAGKPVRCPDCNRVCRVPGGSFPTWLILGPILAGAFLLQLNNLGHTGLTHWDEAYHAVVARNVLEHPLEPTLVDVPYLPYDYRKWHENHVWLHKPILPFWQVALSFAVLGVGPFALRLPAALLATGAAGLTYLIGKDLFDRPTGLVAAVLQALNPFLMRLVHGYQFGDNVDIALLFWVEVAVFFLLRSLRTGSWRDLLLAGVAQGLAWLCKSWLAAIVLGMALTAWLLPLCGLARREQCRIDGPRLAAFLGATLLAVLPWVVFCAVTYPGEFWHEQDLVLRHLYEDVERWAGPWDRVVFDYLIAIYGVFYTPVLIALLALLPRAIRQESPGPWLCYAWAIGVLVPHLFAVTKTPSATLLAVPACLLLLAHLVVLAFHGERNPLVALTAILAASLLFPARINNPGHGYPPDPAFGAIMWQADWVLGHVGGALIYTGLVLALLALFEAPAWLASGCRWAAFIFCGLALAWLGGQTAWADWEVTEIDASDPGSVAVGAFVREQLPANAVLLCEQRMPGEHVSLMFYAQRTCYRAAGTRLEEQVRQIEQAGGLPYVVSFRDWPLPVVFDASPVGPRVYACRPGFAQEH